MTSPPAHSPVGLPAGAPAGPPGVPPPILYLEDDDDIRDLLGALLRESGYDVTELTTAEEALETLRGPRHYALLLTDFRLPNHNADWLLATAKAERLLEKTAVIVLSAEVSPPGIGDLLLLRKPVDVGLLLGHVARAVEGDAHEAALPQPQVDDAPVSLRLYVSASVESLNAERYLRRMLRTVEKGSVSLVVYDVSKSTPAMLDAIEEDRVIVTPTLVRRAPGPSASFLGDLSKKNVEAMLREALAPHRAKASEGSGSGQP